MTLADWSRQTERGSALWVGVIGWIVQTAGWRAGRMLLPGITAWYYVVSGSARAASRAYLSRALGRPATARDVFRHIFTFAGAIMERAFLLSGRTQEFDIQIVGLDALEALVASGRGCVLLGAHFGSFEALRHLRNTCPVPVKALMYRNNAGALTRLLDALDPTLAGSIIEIGDARSMLRVHEAVSGGAIVGMLADRSPAGVRSIPAAFFGEAALFPVGPLIVAATLGCPVMTFCGLRVGARRYCITFMPFADRVVLPRASRQAVLSDHVQRYATWLEAQCRAAPFNWFNFYPFWEGPDAAPNTIMAGGRNADGGREDGGREYGDRAGTARGKPGGIPAD